MDIIMYCVMIGHFQRFSLECLHSKFVFEINAIVGNVCDVMNKKLLYKLRVFTELGSPRR